MEHKFSKIGNTQLGKPAADRARGAVGRIGRGALRAAAGLLAALLLCVLRLPAQTFVYVNDDAQPSNTVSAFKVEASGSLTPIAGSPFSTGVDQMGCTGNGFASMKRLAIAGSYLYASNCFTHTISGFSINPASGVLSLVGTPTAVLPVPEGNPEISLAATPNGQYLIAASDTTPTPGSLLGEVLIQVFSIAGSGALTKTSQYQTTCASVGGIKVSPNGSFLAVPCYDPTPDPDHPDKIHMFAFNYGAGSLSPVAGSPFAAGTWQPGVPLSAEINCANSLLYTGLTYAEPGAIGAFSISATGALTKLFGSPFIPAGGGNGSMTLALSPNDQQLFTANNTPAAVSSFAVSASGTLGMIVGSPAAAPDSTELFLGDLATNQAGTLLYVAAGFSTAPGVFGYKIEPSGALTLVSPLPGGSFFPTNPGGVALSLVVYPQKSCNAGGDSQGPITSNVVAAPVAINTASALTAREDDSTTGGSNIASASYTLNGGAASAMAAQDGAFNQVAENVAATLPGTAETGVRTICVRGKDQPGNTGAEVCIYQPVYDPKAGFVTGGGAVNSPAGADQSNPTAAGAASFGFVSKYLPGRNTPDGNLEFQFKAGNLNFKSTSMEWLVVTNEPRAQFQGEGTINGNTVCKFAVDAWDGSLQPGNADGFGLKIFSCSSGGDRYHLFPTPLLRGSIIIHK